MTFDGQLTINIVTGDARPIFRQLVDEIRIQIACGDLPVGAKLPSVRGLAMQLTVNPNTVAKAYNELTSQGLLESRKGLGIYVAELRQRLNKDEQQKQLQEAIAAFVNNVAYLEFPTDEVLQEVKSALSQLNITAVKGEKDD